MSQIGWIAGNPKPGTTRRRCIFDGFSDKLDQWSRSPGLFAPGERLVRALYPGKRGLDAEFGRSTPSTVDFSLGVGFCEDTAKLGKVNQLTRPMNCLPLPNLY